MKEQRKRKNLTRRLLAARKISVNAEKRKSWFSESSKHFECWFKKEIEDNPKSSRRRPMLDGGKVPVTTLSTPLRNLSRGFVLK